MWFIACLLFVVHSIGMAVDELWFHRHRNLPPWERWGHPLDTLTVLTCYILALTLPLTRGNLTVYIAAAGFSTLFITKDEWVHARNCSGGEMWLHACLFALHPILLGLVGVYMLGVGGEAQGHTFFRPFLIVQSLLTAAFFVYQLLYWNGPWKPALPPTE